jgi:hydrogenase expression/formation protein HypE
MKLPYGKIPVNLLKEIVFKNLGIQRSEVLLGPSAGIDGAVVEVGNRSLIISMDPITGALERIGWLAVNVNANDIATFGVEPAFLFSCILLPESADRKIVETICVQMDKAARKLGIAIAGGHCEVTPRLTNPIVVGCAVGIAENGKYVTAKEARNGDKLVLTKSAGIEGTAILASDRENQLEKVLTTSMLRNAKQFYDRISIVKDATTAYETGGVHAMHDPTEGGVAGAIHEMADASNLGVKIFQERIRVEPETLKICKFFRIDPLQLIASGSLLIAADRQMTEIIVKTLKRNGIDAEVIGEFLSSRNERLITLRDGKVENLARPTADHLWKALQGQPAYG